MRSVITTKLTFVSGSYLEPNQLPTPYKEQQAPLGQSPHTVFPFPAPHVPSLVTWPVLGAVDGFPKTGSCVAEAVAVGLNVEVDEDIVSAAEEHPDMQPAPQ